MDGLTSNYGSKDTFVPENKGLTVSLDTFLQSSQTF
jgi:hypothetical protein